MFFLVMNIPYHCGQIFLSKRKNTIFILPVKFKTGLDHIINVVRTVSFHVADELRWRNLRRNRHCNMYMILDSTNRVNISFHILNLRCDSSVKFWLKNRID